MCSDSEFEQTIGPDTATLQLQTYSQRVKQDSVTCTDVRLEVSAQLQCVDAQQFLHGVVKIVSIHVHGLVWPGQSSHACDASPKVNEPC